jgi:hypothetical protein
MGEHEERDAVADSKDIYGRDFVRLLQTHLAT